MLESVRKEYVLFEALLEFFFKMLEDSPAFSRRRK